MNRALSNDNLMSLEKALCLMLAHLKQLKFNGRESSYIETTITHVSLSRQHWGAMIWPDEIWLMEKTDIFKELTSLLLAVITKSDSQFYWLLHHYSVAIIFWSHPPSICVGQIVHTLHEQTWLAKALVILVVNKLIPSCLDACKCVDIHIEIKV